MIYSRYNNILKYLERKKKKERGSVVILRENIVRKPAFKIGQTIINRKCSVLSKQKIGNKITNS